MAETVSPAAGRRYGVARVCRVWGVPRSSFYAARSAATRAPTAAPARRGPKPAISDADLLAAIRGRSSSRARSRHSDLSAAETFKVRRRILFEGSFVFFPRLYRRSPLFGGAFLPHAPTT